MRHLPAVLTLLIVLLTARAIVPAPDAGAHGTAVVPPPDDCQVTPRTLADVTALTDAPAVTDGGTANPELFIMPPGQPAAETVDLAIRSAIWAFVACTNTGDPLRLAGLRSTGYLQRELNGVSDPAPHFEPTPIAVYQRTALLSVTVIRQLNDGRVGALVHLDDPQDPRVEESVYLAFVDEGGRWLIDDMVEAPEHEELPTATTTLRDGVGKEVGTATFAQVFGGLVTVAVQLNGITGGGSGQAVHVHAAGDCSPGSADLFAAAGGPLPPQELDGAQDPGELDNIGTDTSGHGQYDIFADGFTLSPGPATLFDADGSALVIHARIDDGSSDPEGNSGSRIACGVINLVAVAGGGSDSRRTTIALLILAGMLVLAAIGAVIWRVRRQRRRGAARRRSTAARGGPSPRSAKR